MNNVIIVTGLPRSGTSMMMKMLEAGGISIIYDNERKADEDNPHGYFEFEQVKTVKRDNAWLEGSEGKAIKMVSTLLYDLPPERDYFLIFMKRNLQEVIASQKVMLARKGEIPKTGDEEISLLFSRHLSVISAWLSERKNFKTLYVNYDEVVKQPQDTATKIQKFLGGNINVDNMVKSVDPSLYRQRCTAPLLEVQAKETGLSEDDNEKIKEQLIALGYM